MDPTVSSKTKAKLQQAMSLSSDTASIGSSVSSLSHVTEWHNNYLGVRHGKAGSNIQRILVSSPRFDWEGFSLVEEGRSGLLSSTKEFLGVGSHLFLPPYTPLIYSSPRFRARDSALVISEILEKFLGVRVPVVCSELLNERNYCELEGQPEDRWTELAAADLNDCEIALFGAESVNAMQRRLRSQISLIEQQYNFCTVILVSHCDPLQMLEMDFKGLHLPHYSQVCPLMNAEYRVLGLRPELRMV